jgi:hypothetical protein
MLWRFDPGSGIHDWVKKMKNVIGVEIDCKRASNMNGCFKRIL